MRKLEIREGDFESFFRVPFQVYDGSVPYVSPFKADLKRFLDGRRNPLFSKHGDFVFFTATRGGTPVGRIVAHQHHPGNRRHNLDWSYFGYFDCGNDAEVAGALLERAADWGRKQGAGTMVGNVNLTFMQQIGVVTDRFGGAPYSDQTYSPPHIAELLRQNGFSAFFPMTTFEIDVLGFDPDTLLGGRVLECMEDDRISIEPASRRALDRQMEHARQVLNSGFDRNPFFVPVSGEEFRFQAKDMMWILDPEITVLAYRDGAPVGVVICIPDLNPLLRSTESRVKLSTPCRYVHFMKNRKRAVIVFYSVDPSEQGRGLAGRMLHRVLGGLKRRGYEKLGVTWIADDNAGSLRQMERLRAEPLHKLHLFRKDLT